MKNSTTYVWLDFQCQFELVTTPGTVILAYRVSLIAEVAAWGLQRPLRYDIDIHEKKRDALTEIGHFAPRGKVYSISTCRMRALIRLTRDGMH